MSLEKHPSGEADEDLLVPPRPTESPCSTPTALQCHTTTDLSVLTNGAARHQGCPRFSECLGQAHQKVQTTDERQGPAFGEPTRREVRVGDPRTRWLCRVNEG